MLIASIIIIFLMLLMTAMFFRKQIQSAINDGRLSFADMQIDKQPFPMNNLDLQGKKMLIRPEVAKSANKDNVVVGEPRNIKESEKVSGREIILGKQPNGKETLKITVKNPSLGGGNRKCKEKFMRSSSSRTV